MKIELNDLEFPYYEGLDSEGNFIRDAVINYNDYVITCEVSWWYNFQLDKGDYYTPDYKFATLDHLTIILDEWYDKEETLLHLEDSTKAVILEKIEKHIKEHTNFSI